jgi:hypothetical protein
LRLAAFFREAFAILRFLLAGFLAGIFDSYRSEKNAQLYIAAGHMEVPKMGFFSGPERQSNQASKIVLCRKFHYTTGNHSGVGQTPSNAT